MANKSKAQSKKGLSGLNKKLIALVAVLVLAGAGVYWYVTSTHAGGLVEVPAKEATFYQAYNIAESTGKGLPATYRNTYGKLFFYPTTNGKGTSYKVSGWYEGGITSTQLPYSSIVVYRGSQYAKGPRLKYTTDENGNIVSVTVFAKPGQALFAPAVPGTPGPSGPSTTPTKG